jgi:Rieske Fe-S protein
MNSDDQDLNNQGINRRQFLILAAAGAAMANPEHASARSQEKLIDAGPLSKYSADGLYEGFHDLGFFVVRSGDKLMALSSYCTHRKCKLTAERDHTFYCECHGSTFDQGGKVTQGPATRNLPILQTISDKGHLFVKMSGA